MTHADTLPAGVTAAEREFYLKAFRDKSLLFVVRAADLARSRAAAAVAEVLGTLTTNATRSIVVVETTESAPERRAVETLHHHLCGAHQDVPVPTVLPLQPDADESCLHVWDTLRRTPIFVGVWPARPRGPALPGARRLAIRLKVYKLVLLDPRGGLTANREALSFVTVPIPDAVRSRIDGLDAQHGRHAVLVAAQHALAGGVASVCLCSPDSLAQELFTYEGCGTLFTLTDYCRVERVGVDDFHEVEWLIRRGERDGALKERDPGEASRLLLHGYDARLGTERELVGFCALLPYVEDNAAEIAGLYTRLRFHGGGIGSRLLLKALSEAHDRGLSYVFACTNQDGARRLFERFDFRRVSPQAVPPSKWRAYSPERKQGLSVYKREPV